MNITIYSTTTCPHCKMLKDYLGEKKISFVEKLIDQDDKAREEMMKDSNGFQGVPFVVIEKNGKKEKILGFDKGKIDTILGI